MNEQAMIDAPARTSQYGKWMVLLAAFLGWMFDGLEMGIFPQISRPAMSGHVKRLEASGWIRRTEDAEDGRRSGLVVTPAGQKRIDAIRRRRNDWLVERLARLTPEARDQLTAASAPLLQLLALDP